MMVFVTKASKFYWYEIRKFNTMEDIQQFIEECHNGIIIEKNDVYNDDGVLSLWDGIKVEDIPLIKQCPLRIIIYDSYVE